MLRLLFDADMLVYRVTSAAETEVNWYGDLWTLHSDISECKEKLDSMVVSITDRVLNHLKYEGNYEIVMCFSDYRNFRKTILPSYKANRSGKRKPLAYSSMVDWVGENFTCKCIECLEADDVIGILATEPETNNVIISGDKDMRSIPGLFYDLIHNEFYEVSKDEAQRWHYYQTLVGDTADNYKGCPKVGTVGANKILDAECSWDAVVKAFEKAGLSEDEALVQARVAKILQWEDYELNNKAVVLWTPKDTHMQEDN